MLAAPTARELVVKVAFVPLNVPVPSTVVPFRNCTEPVGVPVVVETTVAVKVTLVPTVAVAAELASVVVLAA
jgi:hypothetical protein